jgi:hypothetical protein
MGLLDGTDRALPKTVETEDAKKKKIMVPNPAYAAWMARDQHVLRFLLNSLSPDILSHVLGMDSTTEAWAGITTMFASASRSKVQHLRSQLHDTKKLTMSADVYFTKMKGFASELVALGKPIEDDEIVSHILNGLDKHHYNSLITTVNGNPGTSLDDLYDKLYTYDMRNGVDEQSSSFSSSANAVKRDTRSRRLTPPPPHALLPMVMTTTTATTVTAAMMTVAIGAVTSAKMIDVMISAMEVTATTTTVVITIVTVLLHPMSTLSAKYARYMDTMQVTVGGATLMTRKMTVTVVKKVLMLLLPMVLIPTGTLI